MAQATIEIPFENVNFEFYKNLHKYIFNDIYDWAGTIHSVNGDLFMLMDIFKEFIR